MQWESSLRSQSVSQVHSLPFVHSTWVVLQVLLLLNHHLIAKFDGTIQFDGLRTVTTENNEGEKIQVVIGRTGEVRIMDVKNDRLLITNNVPYGATLFVKDGQQVKKGDVICTWDPFNNVIVAEIAGQIKFEAVIEGVTYREEADEQTGHREKVVIETKDKTKIPSLIVEGRKKLRHITFLWVRILLLKKEKR